MIFQDFRDFFFGIFRISGFRHFLQVFRWFSGFFISLFTSFYRFFSMLFFSFKNNVSDKMGKWAEGRSTGRKIENGAPKNVSEKMFRKNFFSFSRLSLYGWEKWIKWYGDIVECYVTFSNFMKFHRSSWMIYRTLSAPNELRVEPPPRIIFTNIEIRNLRDDFWKKKSRNYRENKWLGGSKTTEVQSKLG